VNDIGSTPPVSLNSADAATSQAGSSRTARLINRALSEGLIIALVLLVVFFAVANDRFLSAANLTNILQQTAEVGIGAAGQALVILIAGIDLSVGSVVALSGVTAAMLATSGLPPAISILGGLASGVLAGMVNGFGVTRLRVAPIIVTLASMTFLRGVVYTWSNGIPIYSGLPDVFRFIGAGYLGGVVPVPVLILVLVYLLGWLFLNRTVIGTHLFAIGGNREAARLAGIHVDRITVLTYTLCSVLVALAGVLQMGRLSSAQPVAGIGFELDTITAVALGGVSLFGGRGSLVKVFVASVMLAMMGNGFVLLGLSPYVQQMIKGIILLVAVAFDLFLRERKRDAA
jgi:ribose transport system permease protein